MSTDVNAIRYKRLIENAHKRVFNVGYVERHHIVPRSEGGSNEPENLVQLTAREHFLAHWLLYRIYKTPSAAKAFRLMVHDQKRNRGRDYAEAKEIMASAMLGDLNVSKKPEVRIKLKAKAYSPFAGKKRPEHAKLMKQKGIFKGANNPFFGKGERQQGAANHMARKLVGLHIYYGVRCWGTATAAANDLKVSVQAIVQAVKKNQRSKGWRLEYLS